MTHEIEKETELGKTSLLRLLDYLLEPDFQDWTPKLLPSKQISDGGKDKQTESSLFTIQLRLVLEKIDSPDGWRCFFGVLGEDPPNDALGWSFRKVDNAFGGLWLASTSYTEDSYINACEWGKELTEEITVRVNDDSSKDAEEMILQLPAHPVRIFPVRWHGQMLVEDGTLPSKGGCFILVDAAAHEKFRKWSEKFREEGGLVTDFTLCGLRRDTVFFHLNKLERLSQQLRNRFPAADLATAREPRRISLVGGSQVQSAGQQKAYLPFDLPDVVFECSGEAELDVQGAKLEELPSTSKAPEGFPGGTIRQYHFVGEAESDVVTITSISSDQRWVPETRIFGITRDATLMPQGKSAQFNQFGRKVEELGILGTTIDNSSSVEKTVLSNWAYEQFNLSDSRLLCQNAIDDPAWSLLESIAQVRRVTATEFRRRAEKILEWWDRYAWQEARWLRALCHIEVERDARGRLAYVYPVPIHAYLLPAMEDGSFVAVFAGCPTRDQLCSLLENSQEEKSLGVRFKVTPRSEKLLPPRISFFARDLENLKTVLGCLDIPLSMGGTTESSLPACTQIASWAGSIEDWEKGLRWIPGLPPDTEEKQDFSPYLFRMSQKHFSCPYRMRSMKDTQTEKHRWHVLHDNGADGALRDEQYAFLVDPSWGKWCSISTVAPEIPVDDNTAYESLIPVPYETENRALVIPASLVFPTILCRALLTCSGMPPRIEYSSRHYSNNQSPFLPDKEKPYSGACLRYEEIPFQIAQLVCQKVYAKPIKV